MKQSPIKHSWWPPRHIVSVFLAIVSLVILFGLVSYFVYEHPDYGDLKKQYNGLAVPADWKVTSNEDRKNSFWHPCSSFSDIQCPYFARSLHTNTTYSADDAKKTILRIMQQAGYQATESCNTVDPSVCYGEFTAIKSHIKLTIRYSILSRGGADFGVTLETTSH